MDNGTTRAIHRHRFESQTVLACLLAGVGAVGLTVEGRAQDPAGDRQALAALYNATNGRNWEKNDNWLSNKPVSAWHGVTVSNGRVTGLSLGDNRLTGTVPPELGNLSGLIELNLPGNQLAGAIPPELGNLARLTELNLGANQLVGAIPTELGNLSNLTKFSLANNQLTGTIPSELTRLRSLRYFYFRLNAGVPPLISWTDKTQYTQAAGSKARRCRA